MFQEKQKLDASDSDKLIDSISPIRERFVGTNNIKYDHIYYIAVCNDNLIKR